jgi:hypothetical protein
MGAPPSVDDLANLTHAFSAAAIDPSLWETAMDAAAQTTGSVGAALLPIRGQLPNVPMSQSIAESFIPYFRDGWYLRDARHYGVPKMIQSGVMCDFDIANAVDFARDPFYQELLAPFGMR